MPGLQLYVDAANGITQPHQPSYQVQTGVNPSPTLIDDLLTFTVGFVVGKHDEFVVKMMAVAMTSSQTSFDTNIAAADFSNTLVWGGISDVTIGGDAQSEFSGGSASGVDWTLAATAAIPAPAAWPLLSIAVVTCLWRAGRRQPPRT